MACLLFSSGTTALICALFSSVLRFSNHTQLHARQDSWMSDQPVAEASTYTEQHNI
jgi:hypothetical protein